MTHSEILENLLAEAIKNLSSKKRKAYSRIIVENIDVLVTGIENNKSLVSAAVTSMLYKIIEPHQDIRLHKKKFTNGYAARTLDTKVTTPFFKQRFQRYANKESGFLSLVTRVDVPWNLSEESNIAGRSKNSLHCFFGPS
jgi:DNA (cytosine-5)-methyltransferase 1